MPVKTGIFYSMYIFGNSVKYPVTDRISYPDQNNPSFFVINSVKKNQVKY